MIARRAAAAVSGSSVLGGPGFISIPARTRRSARQARSWIVDVRTLQTEVEGEEAVVLETSVTVVMNRTCSRAVISCNLRTLAKEKNPVDAEETSTDM